MAEDDLEYEQVPATIDPFRHEVLSLGSYVVGSVDHDFGQIPQLLVDMMTVWVALADDAGLRMEDRHRMMSECTDVVRAAQESGAVDEAMRTVALAKARVEGSA